LLSQASCITHKPENLVENRMLGGICDGRSERLVPTVVERED